MSDFNLMPAYRVTRRRRRARISLWIVICSVYVVLLIAGAIVVSMLFSSEGANIAHQLEVTSQQIETHNATMLESRRELAQETTQLETWRILQAQPDWSQLLGRLSTELGETMVLNYWQLTTCDSRHEPVAEDLAAWSSSKPLGTLLSECKYNLKLRGFGLTQEAVSHFVLRLEEIGLFDVVRLISSKRQPFLDMQAVAFQIECQL